MMLTLCSTKMTSEHLLLSANLTTCEYVFVLTAAKRKSREINSVYSSYATFSKYCVQILTYIKKPYVPCVGYFFFFKLLFSFLFTCPLFVLIYLSFPCNLSVSPFDFYHSLKDSGPVHKGANRVPKAVSDRDSDPFLT